MKWGEFNLNWARPLKSILSVFDEKIIDFKFYHLTSSNKTFIDKDYEEKTGVFKNFKSYERFLKIHGTIVDQTKRKQIIQKEFTKILSKKKLFILENLKLFDEVVDLVEFPNVLLCDFDKKFLSIPREILILTMQSHQNIFLRLIKIIKLQINFYSLQIKKTKKG